MVDKFNLENCTVQHKHINWVFGILLTILTTTWAVFIPLYLYIYNCQTANAQTLVEQEIQIKVQENNIHNLDENIKIIKLDVKDILKQVNEIDKKVK